MVKNRALALLLSGVAVISLHAAYEVGEADDTLPTNTKFDGDKYNFHNDSSGNRTGSSGQDGLRMGGAGNSNASTTGDNEFSSKSEPLQPTGSSKVDWKTCLKTNAPFLAALTAGGAVAFFGSKDIVTKTPLQAAVKTGTKALFELTSGLGVAIITAQTATKTAAIAKKKISPNAGFAILLSGVGAYAAGSYKGRVPTAVKVGLTVYGLGELAKQDFGASKKSIQ